MPGWTPSCPPGAGVWAHLVCTPCIALPPATPSHVPFHLHALPLAPIPGLWASLCVSGQLGVWVVVMDACTQMHTALLRLAPNARDGAPRLRVPTPQCSRGPLPPPRNKAGCMGAWPASGALRPAATALGQDKPGHA